MRSAMSLSVQSANGAVWPRRDAAGVRAERPAERDEPTVADRTSSADAQSYATDALRLAALRRDAALTATAETANAHGRRRQHDRRGFWAHVAARMPRREARSLIFPAPLPHPQRRPRRLTASARPRSARRSTPAGFGDIAGKVAAGLPARGHDRPRPTQPRARASARRASAAGRTFRRERPGRSARASLRPSWRSSGCASCRRRRASCAGSAERCCSSRTWSSSRASASTGLGRRLHDGPSTPATERS